MTAKEQLQRFRTERDALLERITEIAERDTRVGAAWLFGSLGRGEADALSDLDVFLIIADAHLPAVTAARYEMMALPGTPLLVLEAPQNAPPHGTYNMALYAGEFGPHQVDWYWQAQSAAQIPQQTRVLFDRVGLPHSDSPPHFDYQPVPEREPIEVLRQSLYFFWAMLLITAKYVARSPQEEKMGLLKWVLNVLQDVQRFVDVHPAPTLEAMPPHPQPAEKLRLLRELAGQMEALMPQVAASGCPVPEAIVPSAHRYFAFIEAIMEEIPSPLRRDRC